MKGFVSAVLAQGDKGGTSAPLGFPTETQKAAQGAVFPAPQSCAHPKYFFPLIIAGKNVIMGSGAVKCCVGGTDSCIGTCGVPALHVLPFLAFVSLAYMILHFVKSCKCFFPLFN